MRELAWFVKLDVGYVGHKPAFERAQSYPIVLFTPHPHGGWSVLPWHTLASKQSRCAGLKAEYVPTRGHPGGALIRR